MLVVVSAKDGASVPERVAGLTVYSVGEIVKGERSVALV